MRIKRFRGNITFLALFVLLASALIGVLVGLFMKNFLRYSDDIATYEKTSYLAKAGTELWLAIVNSRNPGLEYRLESGNDLMKNFSCPYALNENWECSHQPAFSLSISGVTNAIENCSEEHLIEVWPWLSVILPLFRDAGLETISAGLQAGQQQPWGDAYTFYGKHDQRKFATVHFSDNMLVLEALTSPDQIRWKLNTYLVIANPHQTVQSLCLQNINGIPQEAVKIVSIWYFKDKQLWTETIAKKALPDFLRSDNYLWGN